MLKLSPFALRLLKASFNAAEDGLAGLQQLAHDANLLFYMTEEGQEGRDAYREKRDARLLEVSPPALSRDVAASARPVRSRPAAHLGDGRAAAHAARRRSRRCSSARRWPAREGEFRAARLLRRADRQRLHPDRDEPLQRLLRRAPRRRHRGAPRAGARDGRRASCRRARCWSRPGSRSAIAVAAGAYLIALVGWELLAIGAASILAGRPLHGRSAPVRIRGARRAVRVPVLRHRRRGRLLLRADRGADAGWRSRCRVPVGLLAAAILMVNNIRDIDTDRRAGKRTLAVRLGRDARPAPVRAADAAARVRLDASARDRGRRAVAAAAAAGRCRSSRRSCARSRLAHRRAVAERRAGAQRGCCWRCSPLLLSAGPAARRTDARSSALEVVPYALPFREPYVTARGRLERRELLLVRLHADGLVGLGEAAPLALRGGTHPGADRERAGRAAGRSQRWASTIPEPQADVRRVAEVSAQARRRDRAGAARTSLARLPGVPVWRAARGASARGRCAATRPSSAGEPGGGGGASAREWAARGFETFKLKAGVDGDVEQVRGGARGASAAGARIRVDANGVLVASTRPRRAPGAMGPLELAEQPVATLEEMARAARRAPTCRWRPTRASSPSRMRARPQRRLRRRDREARQGRRRATRRCAIARASCPSTCRARSTGRSGIAAAAHVAQALARRRARARPRDLAAVRRHDRLAGVRASTGGHLHLPAVPGLGVEIDEDALARQPHRARLASRPGGRRPTATPPSPRRSSRSWRAPACAHACVSPGSRSAPLALALWKEPGDPGLEPRRRALRRLLRARHRAGRPARPVVVADDLRHGGREPPPRGRRGVARRACR